MKRILKFRSEHWYNFLSMIRLHKHPAMPVRMSNINELLQSCTVVLDLNTPKDFERRIQILSDSNIPVLLVYGSAERLISKNSIEKLNERLSIEPNEIVRIDPADCSSEKYWKDLLEKQPKHRSFVIVNGGHFVHCNHHQIINKLIDSLLN